MASRNSKARAWLDLIRIYNLPIPLSGMLAGAYARADVSTWRLVLLIVAATLGCAATQSFNDYEDRDADAVNAGFRPLPSGRLRAASVLLGGHFFALLGAAISVAVEPWSLLAVGGTYLLVRYYPRAKGVTVLNHLMMPAALALTPAYGCLVVHGEVAPIAWLAAGVIFFMDINMNVVGSFKDLWASSAKERVLPLVWGTRPAVLVSLSCGLIALGGLAAAVASGWLGLGVLVPLIPAAWLTISSRVRLYRHPSAREGYRALQAGRLSECLTFPASAAGVLSLGYGLAVISGCVLFALYTQSIMPEAVLPDEADTPIDQVGCGDGAIEDLAVAREDIRSDTADQGGV